MHSTAHVQDLADIIFDRGAILLSFCKKNGEGDRGRGDGVLALLTLFLMVCDVYNYI